ncbi:MAG: N-acetylmuramoyl-L-alanine amidase [Deltaproteobacteria bacterium]|nr:N-acetylmuramoyl-L-alanine amidase [Deltaproteobacteria bacterium]
MTRIFKYVVPALFFLTLAVSQDAGAYMSGPNVPVDIAADGQFTIVIDPGHGGQDNGATGIKGVEEKDITLALAKRLSRTLRKRPGLRVLLTRQHDVFVPLGERTAFANKSRADVFISIHVNSAPKKDVGGIETFFSSIEATDDDARRLAAMENGVEAPAGTSASVADDLREILSDLTHSLAHHESGALAEAVQTSLVAGTGRENRGVKQAPFAVLSGAIMPAALVEVGFISNSLEAGRISSDEDQLKTADSIADGIDGFRKLTAKGNGQSDRRQARQTPR